MPSWEYVDGSLLRVRWCGWGLERWDERKVPKGPKMESRVWKWELGKIKSIKKRRMMEKENVIPKESRGQKEKEGEGRRKRSSTWVTFFSFLSFLSFFPFHSFPRLNSSFQSVLVLDLPNKIKCLPLPLRNLITLLQIEWVVLLKVVPLGVQGKNKTFCQRPGPL